MSSIAIGSFAIDQWDEKPVRENPEGGHLALASVRQTYSGDLEGQGQVEFQMLHAADKSARFIGYERVDCTLAGKRGSFYLEHQGTFSIGVASSRFKVVNGSGRGELMNISGEGQFTAEAGGKAAVEFRYNLDGFDDQTGN